MDSRERAKQSICGFLHDVAEAAGVPMTQSKRLELEEAIDLLIDDAVAIAVDEVCDGLLRGLGKKGGTDEQ